MPIKQWKILGMCIRTSDRSQFNLVVLYSTAIGLKVKGGVVVAVEKLVHSKLLVPGANRRIQTIDRHIGLVCSSPVITNVFLAYQGISGYCWSTC